MVFDISKLSVDQTKRLNQISYEIRGDYVDCFDKLAVVNADSLDWIFSAVASKDLHQTDSFLTLTQLCMIKEEIEKGSIKCIKIANYGLYRVVREHFPRTKVILSRNESVLRKGIKSFREALRNLLYAGFRLLWTNSFRQYHKQMNNETKVLVDTFILDSSFNGNEYRDRWYPGISQHVDTHSKSKLAFVPTLIMKPWKIKKCLKLKGDIRFLFKESFLKPKDYLWALLHPVRLRKNELKNISFKGVDISPLLNYELKSKALSQASLKACLNYRFIKNYIDQGNVIETLIEWNENQIIDKSLNLAMKKFSPESKVHGYRSFIQTDQYVHMSPTDVELEQGLFPQKVFVGGEIVGKMLLEFTSKIEVLQAPAFRFNVMFEEQPIVDKTCGRFEILVALPIDIETSKSILRSVLRIDEFKGPNYKVVIRPHPNYSSEYIDSLTPENTTLNLDYSSGPFKFAVSKANLLISTQSTSCLEALCYGTPVIVYAAQNNFTMNPIPKSIPNEFYKVAFSENEILAFLNKIVNEGLIIDSNARNKMISSCFNPILVESTQKFLNV